MLLRTITISSRAILIFVLAKYLTPSDVGIYGLLTATVAIFSSVAGFEFYSYNTREIINSPRETHPEKIRDQLYLHGLTYIFVPMISFYFYYADILIFELIILLSFIIIFDHLCHEFARLLFILYKPAEANTAIFLRHGLWPIIFLIIIASFPDTRNIKILLIIWLLSLIISLFYSLNIISNIISLRNITSAINWNWIKRGLYISSLYFIGTFMFTLIDYFDRFILQNFATVDYLGVFIVYIGTTNIIRSFSYFGIVSIIYPKLVRYYNSGEMYYYNSEMKKLIYGSLITTIIIATIIGAFSKTIFEYFDEKLYVENLTSFYILLAATIFSVISYGPHYALFVRNRDRDILITTSIAFIVFLASGLFLIYHYGLVGAAIAKLIGFITLAIGKFLALHFVKNGVNNAKDQ